MYLNKLKSGREACRHGRQHRNLSATVNWNPNQKISLPVGGTEINLSAEQICRVHALSPVSTRHRPVRSNTNDGGHGDPTSRSDLARDKGIFDLSTSFSQSTMTWKKTKLDMVEWWGSGGGLDGGSFRALSFATEYSPSNYFTDSGNHLRSNDDEFYQMSPLLLQTIQLQKRRREVFPWRDPQLTGSQHVNYGLLKFLLFFPDDFEIMISPRKNSIFCSGFFPSQDMVM